MYIQPCTKRPAILSQTCVVCNLRDVVQIIASQQRWSSLSHLTFQFAGGTVALFLCWRYNGTGFVVQTRLLLHF